MVLVIWGNSLVPGERSGGLSLAVLQAAHRFLASLGLPYEWITHLLVRKTAHFTEYMLLGVATAQAFDPQRTVPRGACIAALLACALTASIDETIQLFVADRSGQITDVLLDCCGAATGVLIRSLVIHIHAKK